MRMIVCNVWGGRIFEPLMQFINEEKEKTDIFLFQEIYSTHSETKEWFDSKLNLPVRVNLLAELSSALSGFEAYSSPSQDKAIAWTTITDFDVEFGLTGFVKRGIDVRGSGEIFVLRQRNARTGDASTEGKNLQFFAIEQAGRHYTVCNFHGIWTGQGKGDAPDRILQSTNIRKFLDQIKGPKILAGDFNLLPGTDSLKIIEEGMVNLITKYGITDTRGALYTKPLRFADYMLVSPDVTVKSFAVPKVAISDHLPMIVEFE
ncbi:MAG: endonuclease/exonuclease/phosphatase family protein [Patescibacteria group bacterium]|jgi:exonuclease III